MRIKYIDHKTSDGFITSITVILDGVKRGTINMIEGGGWQYRPFKWQGGEIFATIEEVKKSLEEE